MKESHSSESEKKLLSTNETSKGRSFFSGFMVGDSLKRVAVLLAFFAPFLVLGIFFKFALSTFIFVFYFLTFLIFRLDGRIAVATGLLFLLSLPFLLILGRGEVAEQAAIYAYFFLVIGVALEVAEMFRRRINKRIAPLSGKEQRGEQEKHPEELAESEVSEEREGLEAPEVSPELEMPKVSPEPESRVPEPMSPEEEDIYPEINPPEGGEERAAYPREERGGFHRQIRPGPRLERLKRRRVRLRRARRRRTLVAILFILAFLFSVAYLASNWWGGQEREVAQKKPPPKPSAEEKERPERLAVKPTKKTPKETETPPAIDKSKVKVEIQNGNGISKEAARIAALLKKVGYGNLQTTDAERNDYPQTIIRYSSGKKNIAEAVAKDLSSEYPSLLREELSPQSPFDVVIVLGLDRKKLAVDKSQVKIKILNGNGINKEARRIGDILEQAGYTQVSIGEASHYNYLQTLVQYKPGKTLEAKAVSQDISSYYPSKLEQTLQADSPQDIVVTLGKDKKG